jgi:hypothetical protein
MEKVQGKKEGKRGLGLMCASRGWDWCPNNYSVHRPIWPRGEPS